MRLFTGSEEDTEAIRKICSCIDYSSALITNASKAQVIQACEEAKRYKMAAVAVFPSYLSLVAEHLKGTSVAPQLPCGFPSGGVATSIKQAEVAQALKDGAREVDMVLNIGRLVDRDYAYVENDIKAVVDAAHDGGVTCKVILEVGFLQDDDKRAAVDIACKVGADFIKTCTGFAEGKATFHDIALIKECAKGRLKIKASGGVASLEDQAAFIEAGASRVAGRFNIVSQMQKLGIQGF
ncbi:MAG: deoxyribose-phosphate aldolase [Planctomycetes bacterium]|nr:deoxyribose-phosphate aldolase [Planctomycetota bacterium]